MCLHKFSEAKNQAVGLLFVGLWKIREFLQFEFSFWGSRHSFLLLLAMLFYLSWPWALIRLRTVGNPVTDALALRYKLDFKFLELPGPRVCCFVGKVQGSGYLHQEPLIRGKREKFELSAGSHLLGPGTVSTELELWVGWLGCQGLSAWECHCCRRPAAF